MKSNILGNLYAALKRGFSRTGEKFSCKKLIPVVCSQCPLLFSGAEGPLPSQTELPTGEVLYNLTSRNVSDWIVKTGFKELYRRKRFA